jgi:1-hydroxycarotenoid 3,4-desaturase
MDNCRCLVIGAGVGGLAAAIMLASRGCSVTVLERGVRPGGKLAVNAHGDTHIDAGPTVFTMRWAFDALFAATGTTLEAALPITPLPVLARHAWPGGGQLDLHRTVDETADAIGAFAGAADARGYRAFAAESARIFDVLRGPYLESPRPSLPALVQRIGVHRVNDLLAIRPFDTLWSALGRHFRDPRLRQLFGRYATYCGSSPFVAPATLMLIAHVEQAGVWSVDGGMARLAQALATAAERLGVTIRCDANVRTMSLRGGRIVGAETNDGAFHAADAVLFNGDPAALASGALGDDLRAAAPPTPPRQRSLSAITWTMQTEATGFPLSRHTVFFSSDYAREFAYLSEGTLPRDPTIYVCAQDRLHDKPGGDPERLFVLANAPARGDGPPTPEEYDACEARVFDRLHRSGLMLSSTHATRTTPRDFHARFPGTGGALYGRATHGWMAAFQRPGARTTIPGLYLAGGATHPGAGVPMAALSGQLAAHALLQDRASTRTFHLAVTPGGTSTRSATTADTG